MAIISTARAQEPVALEATQVAAADIQVAAAVPQQVAAAQPQEEEILVTGSLIHGAAAVGVPVTSLSVEDFKLTGAVTIGDLFKNVPAVYMIPQNDVIAGGGYIARAQNINLRNLSTRGTRTLLLIDNMRFPNQGRGGCQLDPSIIPQIAVDHIDLLADGASATYGSDAVAGVINVILKRGYEGATTQLQMGASQDHGHASYTFSQLYGRTWDTGGITLAYEWYKQNHTGGGSRPYLTQDFFAFQGLDDRRNLIHSRPGVVTIGAPTAAAGAPTGFAANLGQTCSNCFSIPKGQNGIGLTWAAIQANPGVKNQVELFADAWAEPTQKRNAVTMTFDQEIMDGVSLFVDGWYSNRRSLMHQQAGNNSFSVTVPTNNPYFPIGAPAGLRVNYDLNLEFEEPGRVAASEIADRYNAGFNIELPFEWMGKIYAAVSQVHNIDVTTGTVTNNMLSAALGNTIASVAATNNGPAIAAFAKPANIPFLNLFCDPTAFKCNDDATLNYVTGFSNNNQNAIVKEYGVNADGEVLALPAGPMRGAVGFSFTNTNYNLVTNATNANNTAVVNYTTASGNRDVYSIFGQLNIPVVNEDMQIPLVEDLELELSGRYDHYSDFGSTKNPKVAVDWTVGYGLTVKGSWGTAFRAPSFQEAALTGPGAINIAAGATSNTIGVCPTIGVPAVPGTPAAFLNPNCTQALQFLGGLTSGYNPEIRGPGYTLGPEKAMTLSAGFEFVPSDEFGGILRGLNISATYWFIKINDLLNLNVFSLAGVQSGQLGNPNFNQGFLTAENDPDFAAHVLLLLNGPRSSLSPTIAPNIAFIADNGVRNMGWQSVNGWDFNASYSYDTGAWGAFETGVTGTYVIDNKSLAGPGQRVVSVYRTPASPNTPALDSGGRLKYRGRVGWTDVTGAWSVTTFVNFIPHYNSNSVPLPPPCFQVGNTPCNASGNPAFAQYTQQYDILTSYVPGQYIFDLSVGYQTGDTPANDYLKNIRLQLTVSNVMNKEPPFAYQISPPGGAQAHAHFSTTAGSSVGIDGRVITLSLTKEW